MMKQSREKILSQQERLTLKANRREAWRLKNLRETRAAQTIRIVKKEIPATAINAEVRKALKYWVNEKPRSERDERFMRVAAIQTTAALRQQRKLDWAR
jgi:hypothetical protein